MFQLFRGERNQKSLPLLSFFLKKKMQEKEELAKEKEKEKEGAASYASSSATTEEVKESDMSDVFYNHVAWTDLNVLQEIGQGAFALVYEVCFVFQDIFLVLSIRWKLFYAQFYFFSFFFFSGRVGRREGGSEENQRRSERRSYPAL